MVLFKAGDQLPVIPLSEVVGNAVSVPPVHMGATAANVGTVLGSTTIVIVSVVAHTLAVGVNI